MTSLSDHSLILVNQHNISMPPNVDLKYALLYEHNHFLFKNKKSKKVTKIQSLAKQLFFYHVGKCVVWSIEQWKQMYIKVFLRLCGICKAQWQHTLTLGNSSRKMWRFIYLLCCRLVGSSCWSSCSLSFSVCVCVCVWRLLCLLKPQSIQQKRLCAHLLVIDITWELIQLALNQCFSGFERSNIVL